MSNLTYAWYVNLVISMGPKNAYKNMLDYVVSLITCVSMNHQNQLEQMATGAMFATAISPIKRSRQKARVTTNFDFPVVFPANYFNNMC
jgi:hypothetical protein